MTTEATDSDLKRKVDDLKTEGWKVSEEGNNRAVMMKPDYGGLGIHIIIFIIFGWWTLGIANAAYAGWCYFKRSDKRVVRSDE